MSETVFAKTNVAHKPSVGEAIAYKAVVTSLFFVSAFAIAAGRVIGAKRHASLWQESKEAAYAVAGYAFKY